MPRIRYIKPDFFLDDDLAEQSFETRLAFAGLWCYADKSGRLEDNPKKLKVEILPYDKVDMNNLLNNLTKKPFIIRYELNNKKYIQILNFLKHQKPHHTEKDSDIPLFNGEITVKERLDTSKEQYAHSPLPIPIPIKEGSTRETKFDFESIWTLYPNKDGKKVAKRSFDLSVQIQKDWEDINKALENYKKSERVRKGYIKNGSTWFTNWRDWIDASDKGEKNEDIPREFREYVKK